MYSEIILSTHAFVPKSELRNPLGNLKRAFILQSKYEEDIQIKTFAETETHFGYPLYYDALFEKHALAFSSCDTVIGKRRFSRAVYDAAHHSDGDVASASGKALLRLICKR